MEERFSCGANRNWEAAEAGGLTGAMDARVGTPAAGVFWRLRVKARSFAAISELGFMAVAVPLETGAGGLRAALVGPSGCEEGFMVGRAAVVGAEGAGAGAGGLKGLSSADSSKASGVSGAEGESRGLSVGESGIVAEMEGRVEVGEGGAAMQLLSRLICSIWKTGCPRVRVSVSA